MITEIRTKIRALIEDLAKSGIEVFTYSTSAIFTLQEDHITSLTAVLHNGDELGTGEYSFDSTTNKITINATVLKDDIIEVDYLYYKYSDTELSEYVRAGLVWISGYNPDGENDLGIEDGEIFPTPSNRMEDLISLVSSILIKPDYNKYELPTVKVTYNGKIPKDQKIEKLILKYRMGVGITGVITFD